MNKVNIRFEEIIKNPENWPKFQKLIDLAIEIVYDFDQFGEILQSNNDDNVGRYDQHSTIEKLRGAIYRIDNIIINYGDWLSHLTDEQQDRLKAVAVEVVMAADGDKSPTLEIATDDVETMTPHERLVATGFFEVADGRQERLIERLGFNPLTGDPVCG
jgi:hypothetical protein